MASVKILDSHKKRTFKLKSKPHFYIKFVGVQIPGYGANNAPPIGIAIIGFNNYIL
jgi:hypothetical protein